MVSELDPTSAVEVAAPVPYIYKTRFQSFRYPPQRAHSQETEPFPDMSTLLDSSQRQLSNALSKPGAPAEFGELCLFDWRVGVKVAAGPQSPLVSIY